MAQQLDVVVVEVGPRDGLQNESTTVPTAAKVAFINTLSDAGLPVVEATSFVNPKLVPQLSDAAEVMAAIDRRHGALYPVLVPNAKGLERALQAEVDAIALFTAATDEFAAANVGTTIDGTFERFAEVVAVARRQRMWVRGYVSVAFGCPYAGSVHPRDVASVATRLLDMECDEICLADTIGVAAPADVRRVLEEVQPLVPLNRLALHFHDTSGMAIANVEAGLESGIRVFDAAASGLGGCPFALGAPGNLATESLVDRLHLLGMRTGIDATLVRKATDVLRPFVPRLSATAA